MYVTHDKAGAHSAITSEFDQIYTGTSSITSVYVFPSFNCYLFDLFVFWFRSMHILRNILLVFLSLLHSFFLFLCWRYNPLWVLAFSVIFFHSVLSLLSFLHPLIPVVWMSFSTSSIHLFLGLPLILLPIAFHSNILLGILPPSISITCPSQATLLLFINLTMSAFPMSSFSSWFFSDSSNSIFILYWAQNFP